MEGGIGLSDSDLLILNGNCPLLGFANVPINGLTEIIQGGKCTCGILRNPAVCPMISRDKKPPSWKNCQYNTEEYAFQLEQLAEVKIFPLEMKPENFDSWPGVAVKEWFRYNGLNILEKTT
jgi:hypothetical protein